MTVTAHKITEELLFTSYSGCSFKLKGNACSSWESASRLHLPMHASPAVEKMRSTGADDTGITNMSTATLLIVVQSSTAVGPLYLWHSRQY